jgi:hypothetical protein
MPHRGPEGMNELNQIALRFEDKIYTQAASQKDYLQRISLKMLSLESKANQPSFPGGSPGNNQRPLDPGGMIPAQIRNRQPRSETCMQIALAIKDEVEDLEAGKIQVPKIAQVKSLRLFETFDRFNALGRVEDKGGFQENKEWQNCW